jgi:transcriptional regulator with XRE-family HTH domain
MRQLDLQRIRKEHNVTQLRLAELTKYPQSFISQIERGRVDAPEKFYKKLTEVLGIKDFEPYMLPERVEIVDQKPQVQPEAQNNEPCSNSSEEQKMASRLLDMIDRRDQRISELESENKRLHELLLRLYEK